MWNVTIFASGSGSNAENIFNYFKDSKLVRVGLLITDNPKAFVIERCRRHSVPCLVLSKRLIDDTDFMLGVLRDFRTNFVVLAGYIKLVPDYIVAAFDQRIVNIHPSLLPKHGGKGMYGSRVHQSVLDSGDKESGITIHFIDNDYDRGSVIFQAKCPVLPDDTADTLAQRVHALEYEHYPKVIEDTIIKVLGKCNG
ncbi:MAG: phosphoribosylglycinamide formyltransferase [Bacteroidales bacterium]|nr:phosphoribosylglycinamide formyltransferase [Bacteroidales bacterium]MBQ3618444.1 phosphoribosylglycinamide formyltransferase [Bacteroidales bacterium]